MTDTEKALEKISDFYYSHDPEAVHYIEQIDGEGYKVQEIDGSYCHSCAIEKAKALDIEHDGKFVHQVYEESSPEDCYFRTCENCGCLLNSSLIASDLAEDDINDIVDELKKAKSFEDITPELGWKMAQFTINEDDFKPIFPKQMGYIVRKLANLYKKNEIKK